MGYRRSSVRTSGTFWGKSPYADGLTYGMYGTDGDYNNSLTYMFGEMTDRFGFMVFTADRDQIEYEDGFDTDYDAEVAAESWIEQNASQYITASVASRNMIASDGQFVFYDEKFNPGNGLYLVAYYGPENDKRDSLVLELEGDAATYFTCTVKAPDGTVIDTFTVDDWESYKSGFYGEMDYGILDFDEYLNDWMDRKYGVSAGPNTASRNSSVKRSYISEFDTWGESVDSYNEDGPFHATIAYGEPYNDDNSVTMEAVGDNGVDGLVNCKVLDISWDNVIDTFQAETWDEAVREFEYRCRQYEYDEYLESDDEEFLRLNGIDASRKTSANIDYEYYGAIYEPSNGVDGIAYYGPENDEEDSLTIEIVGNDQTGYDCRIVSPSGEDILGEFTAISWDSIPDFLEDVVDSNELDKYLDRYLESVSNYNSWINEVRGSTASKRIRSSKVHRTSKTAKRKMTMKEKLALINEDKLDEEDDPINPFF